eukprot:TRINITY_DN31366_c0_g1_i1.p1 TRINITY_DN31366_c0_g1~~TRINITY_DN31366_c0_g1_i1.p1  ORF type:complete len:205 (+),score=44.21 TRINITY_DN31366_c0_g1_i1:52-666(+)
MSFSRRSSISMGSKSSDSWMLTEESSDLTIHHPHGMSCSKWSESMDEETASDVSCTFGEKIYRPQMSSCRVLMWCSEVSDTCCTTPSCSLFHLEDVKNKPELLDKVRNLSRSVSEVFKVQCYNRLDELSVEEVDKSVSELSDLCFDFPPSNTPLNNLKSVVTLLIDDLYMDLHRGIPSKRRDVISYILKLLFRPVQYAHNPYQM